MKNTVINVSYTVEVTDKDKDRLVELANETGNDFNDAGPILSIRRLLMDIGIDGAFPDEHGVGLNVRLNDEQQKV